MKNIICKSARRLMAWTHEYGDQVLLNDNQRLGVAV